MGLETGTYINDLVNTNPVNSDQESQGAAHLRLIKAVLQNQFPGASKAWPLPTSPATVTANFTILQTDFNKTFIVDTTAGTVTATLPSLVSGDAGWTCRFIKLNTGTNPLRIAPASGNITSGEISGLTVARRCIPGHPSDLIWTGTAFFITRVPRVPVGSLLALGAASGTLPVGYEWPNGQTLASASTNYPEYFSLVGSGATVDIRDRAIFAAGNMGGLGDKGLITVAGGNWDGTVIGAVGGAQNQTLTSAQIPAHTHVVSGNTGNDTPDHTHTIPFQAAGFALGANSGLVASGAGNPSTSGASTRHTHPISLTSDNGTGGGLSHPIMPPGVSLGVALTVE